MTGGGTIAAAITGMVGLVSAYITYRVGMASAQKDAKPSDETLQQGESAMNIVRTGLSQYGDADEKADLANFERNPQRYTDALQQALSDLAARYPVFRQQLESFVQQNDVKASVQGSVHVGGQGKIFGNALGVNQGNIAGGSYTVNERDVNP